LKTVYRIPAFLSQCSQSSSSKIKGTTTTNVFFVTIAATIGIIDFPLPVGSATSKSEFPLIAYLMASYCLLDIQLYPDEQRSFLSAASAVVSLSAGV